MLSVRACSGRLEEIARGAVSVLRWVLEHGEPMGTFVSVKARSGCLHHDLHLFRGWREIGAVVQPPGILVSY